ncbi:hypothetical protein K0M31_015821 [Melipona bicolor]|uniref:Fatty acyl-CoA reductase n=1 Tax=Melipona bicolor TaxID=60889 RepID=A0AA40FES0_9HYME|nr:hypothetical protein K0M31_015821 [Melipona bicolor]
MTTKALTLVTLVFEFIKAKHGSPIFSKLHLVEGNVNLPDLGLSLEDRIMLIEKVNIVFHVAAAISFKQPLDDAVNTNTKGIQSNDFLSLFNVIDLGIQIGKSNVKMVPAKKDTRLDLVAVDYVIDTILCAV